MSESTDLKTVVEREGKLPIRGFGEEGYTEDESSGPNTRLRVYWEQPERQDSSSGRNYQRAVFLIYKLVDYVSAGSESISEEFKRLKEKWEDETAHVASPREKAIHPSYQRIIGMGMAAVPFILSELKRKPDHWFWALKAITGVDPVPPENMGDMKQMAEDWADWFEERGLAEDKFVPLQDEWRSEVIKKEKRQISTNVKFGKDTSTS